MPLKLLVIKGPLLKLSSTLAAYLIQPKIIEKNSINNYIRKQRIKDFLKNNDS